MEQKHKNQSKFMGILFKQNEITQKRWLNVIPSLL